MRYPFLVMAQYWTKKNENTAVIFKIYGNFILDGKYKEGSYFMYQKKQNFLQSVEIISSQSIWRKSFY